LTSRMISLMQLGPRPGPPNVGYAVPEETALVGSGSAPTFGARVQATWPMGLGLLLVGVAALVFQIRHLLPHEATFEWVVYAVIGLLYPAFMLATGKSVSVRSVLGVVFIAGTLILAVVAGPPMAVFLGVVQGVAVAWWQGRRGQLGSRLDAAAIVAVSVAGWMAALRIAWWDPTRGMIFHIPLTAPVFLPALALVAWCLLRSSSEWKLVDSPQSQRIVSRITDGVAILLLGADTLDADHLFATGGLTHWSVLVGPAEMVREGGRLLWDVPSQYGLLNTAILALWPTSSVWQALYEVTAICVWTSAVVVYVLLRQSMRGPLGHILAFLVATVAVFSVPRSGFSINGPVSLPSTGGYRFVWCYVLLAVLLRLYMAPSGRTPWRPAIYLGIAAWAVGVFWSSESALYCSAIWLPAYAYLLLIERPGGWPVTRAQWRDARLTIVFFVVPLALAGIVVVLVSVVYAVAYGHTADWRAFIDYSASFGSGFGNYPIDFDGSVWTLLAFGLIVATAAGGVLRGLWSSRVWLLLSGAWTMWWITASYFVGRSHSSNVSNLFPIGVAVLAVALIAIRSETTKPAAFLVRALCVPLLAVPLTVTYGQTITLIRSDLTPSIPVVESRLPVIDPQLHALLLRVHVGPASRVVLLDTPVTESDYAYSAPQTELPVWRVTNAGSSTTLFPHAWLPIYPLDLLVPLAPERRTVYLNRFVEQARLGGWLIDRLARPYQRMAWLQTVLKRHFDEVKSKRSGGWRVTEFAYRR
jgi:hypothetical protein